MYICVHTNYGDNKVRKITDLMIRREAMRIDGDVPSQETIARIMNVSLGAYGKWERANRIPKKSFRATFERIENQYKEKQNGQR